MNIRIKLNPDLDIEEYARAYASDQFVRIENVFEDETAEQIYKVISQTLKWRLVFPEPKEDGSGEQVCILTQDDIAKIPRDVMARRMQDVMRRASENYGYLYNSYPMIQSYTDGWDPDHPIHLITEFLNSSDFLDFARAITGIPEITKADAQATLYTRGNFLTRHKDEGFNNERRAAYTLGFTKGWQPDWGGLLAFFDENLDVERAYYPRFNALSLFDGTVMHAVTALAPYTPLGRYQITGWLRDDPPYKAG